MLNFTIKIQMMCFILICHPWTSHTGKMWSSTSINHHENTISLEILEIFKPQSKLGFEEKPKTCFCCCCVLGGSHDLLLLLRGKCWRFVWGCFIQLIRMLTDCQMQYRVCQIIFRYKKYGYNIYRDIFLWHFFFAFNLYIQLILF